MSLNNEITEADKKVAEKYGYVFLTNVAKGSEARKAIDIKYPNNIEMRAFSAAGKLLSEDTVAIYVQKRQLK